MNSCDAGPFESRTGTTLLRLVSGNEKRLFFQVSEGFPEETYQEKRARAREIGDRNRKIRSNRDAKITELLKQNLPVKEIAVLVGCCQVTVYRVLNRQRNGD